MIFNVDCDGVMTNGFHEAIRPYADKYGWTTTNNPTKWHFYEDWLDQDELPGNFHTLYQQVWKPAILEWNLYEDMNLTEGVTEFFNVLAEQDHHVRIVTSIYFSDPDITTYARAQRATWLSNFEDLIYDDLVFTGEHGKQSYTADVIIDDKPSEEWQQPGKLNILFSQPWNLRFEWYDYKTNDFNSILEIVDEYYDLSAKA